MVVTILHESSPGFTAGAKGEVHSSARFSGSRQKLTDQQSTTHRRPLRAVPSVRELLDQVALEHTKATAKAVLAQSHEEFVRCVQEVAEWGVQYWSLKDSLESHSASSVKPIFS
jgi:hypothetical protein